VIQGGDFVGVGSYLRTGYPVSQSCKMGSVVTGAQYLGLLAVLQ
jgi:hypothetical protein